MQNIVAFSDSSSVKAAIKTNWENYHYCLGRSPNVELSIGKYLTWLVTDMPDHFMNLVVCTHLPDEGIAELIGNALSHFRDLNIRKLSWLAEEGASALELKKHLTAHGLTFRESFATEMAIDLTSFTSTPPAPTGLTIIPVEDDETLKQWIHVASIGFGVPKDIQDVWFKFFTYAACTLPFRT